MKLHVINSGSSGNCYLLESMEHTLIIECGKGTFENCIKAIANFEKLDGILVSHSHTDHNGDLHKYSRYKIPTYQSYYLVHGEQIEVGPWSIIPVNVSHDNDVICQSFFIKSNIEQKIVLFSTDCFSYSHLTGIMLLDLCLVECNHSNQKLWAGDYPDRLKTRISQTHCNTDRCREAVQAARCERFVFCHASNDNINKAETIEAFKSEFKNRFFAFAEPNFVIEF